VVIATQGRPQTLARTLGFLGRCDPVPEEVVVVDGDGTSREAVEGIGSNGFRPDLRYLVGGSSESARSHYRNIGVERASGDVVVFLDDDARPLPALFAVLGRAYRDPAVIGATGLVIEPARRKFGGVASRIRRFLFPGGADGTMTRFGYPRRIVEPEREWDVEWMQGCLMSARRDAASEIRLDERIPTDMGCEDEDFAYRLSRRGRVRYLPNAMVIHELLGLTSRHRDQRRFDRDAQFAGLLLVLLAHRIVNREWSGVAGLIEGMRIVWRERRTPLPDFFVACREAAT
jgi:GT2 family glycosyltransferase